MGTNFDIRNEFNGHIRELQTKYRNRGEQKRKKGQVRKSIVKRKKGERRQNY